MSENTLKTQLSFFISAPQADRKELSQVMQLLVEYELVVSDLKMFSEQERAYLYVRAEGSWSQVSKCEIALNLIDSETWRVEFFRPHGPAFPPSIAYNLSAAFKEDQSLTLSQLMTFFADLNVLVEDLKYQVMWLDDAHEHGVSKVTCVLRIPLANSQIHFIRDRFYTLCDVLSVDGSIELADIQQRV